MNESPEKNNIPHPSETHAYSYQDMIKCWHAARENLVRYGTGDCDRPDFATWCKNYVENKTLTKFNSHFIPLTIEEKRITIPELIEEFKEENEIFDKCPSCDEQAWDGRICHVCGMKII